jgi:phage I-like protein
VPLGTVKAQTPQRALFAIELAASGEPPAEFRLFAAGANKTHDGRGSFLFDDLSATACMTHCRERGLDYAIDYEHASLSFLQVDPAEAGKAAGWFTLAIRNGEAWATGVQWTPKAAEKLKAREFRYFSPAADCETTPDGAKRITKVINCALTNNPALAGIPPLMASAVAEPKKETRMKTLLTALSLAETASEAEALAALTKVKDGLAALLSLTGKATEAEALGVISGWKTEAEKVAAISTELATLKSAQVEGEKSALIDQGKKDGKLPPALEGWAKGQSVESLKAYLSAAPKIGAAPAVEPSSPQAGNPDAAVAQAAALLSLDPKKVAELKATKTAAV